jgi:predicted transcriptional regulator
MTKLQKFITSRGIKPAHIAKLSGYSRQHLLRLRQGKMEPTRKCIKAVRDACRQLTQQPRLRASQLFDV